MNWLTDYLDNSQQRVIIKNYKSSYKSVSAGVPQGSVLGALLFLIYINDIADSLLSLARLFAVVDIEGIINHDLLLLAA